MNWSMVGRLLAKEWYFGRFWVGTFIGAGLLMLLVQAAFATGSNPALRVISIVLFYGVLNGLIWLPVPNIVMERTTQTLSFLMSLPITIREYSAAKLLANLIVFLVPWALLGAAVIALVASNDAFPNAYIPLIATLFVELLALYAIVLGVALVSESAPITQAVGILGNIVYWFSWSFIGVAPGFGLNQDPAAVWNSPLFLMLPGCLVSVPLVLGLTVYLQSRKKDFI